MKSRVLILVGLIGLLAPLSRARAEVYTFGFDSSVVINWNGLSLNPVGIGRSAGMTGVALENALNQALYNTHAACWALQQSPNVSFAVVWIRAIGGVFQWQTYNPPANPFQAQNYLAGMIAQGYKIRCSGMLFDIGANGILNGQPVNFPLAPAVQALFGLPFTFVGGPAGNVPGGGGPPLGVHP